MPTAAERFFRIEFWTNELCIGAHNGGVQKGPELIWDITTSRGSIDEPAVVS